MNYYMSLAELFFDCKYTKERFSSHCLDASGTASVYSYPLKGTPNQIKKNTR